MQGHVGSPLLLIFTLALGGCGHVTPIAGLPRDVTAWTPALPPMQIAGKLKQLAVGAKVEDLIKETRSIILSRAFREHLRDYSDLSIGPFRESSDGTTTLATYLGLRPDARPLPVWVLGFKDGGSSVALTGICPGDTFAELRIGRITVKRWLRSSAVSKSCAINTMAHELTHTVLAPRAAGPLYTDDWYQVANKLGQEFVSYGVGTIAQCTYLEQQDPPGTFDFARCLRRYGTEEFRPTGCDKLASTTEDADLDIAEATTNCIMTKPPTNPTQVTP